MKRVDIDNQRLSWQVIRRILKTLEDSKDKTEPHIGQLWEDGSIHLHCFLNGVQTRTVVQRAIQACWMANYFTQGEKELTYDKSQTVVKLHLTPAAVAFGEAAVPEWIPPKPPKLTEEDLDILEDLESFHRNAITGGWSRFAMPMEVGGTDGSHHSSSLKKLCANGFVELSNLDGRKTYPMPPSIYKRGKGSNRYGITEAGLKLVAARKAERKAKREAK